jgi:sirohydrochlorin cobaltochelatase
VSQGLLLLAHGARDPRWAEPFETLTQRLRVLAPGAQVRLSFLDFLPPTLADAAAEMTQLGVTRVDVLPLFLGTGGHVRNDVPKQVAELALAYPDVTWTLRRAIGEVDSVIDAMAAGCLALASEAELAPAQPARDGA